MAILPEAATYSRPTPEKEEGTKHKTQNTKHNVHIFVFAAFSSSYLSL
jgi:hypothetical protein